MMEFPPTELELSTTFGERPEKFADSVGSKERNSIVETNREIVSSLSNRVKNLRFSVQVALISPSPFLTNKILKF